MLRKVCDGIYCYEDKPKTICYDGFCFETEEDNEGLAGNGRSNYLWIGLAVAIMAVIIFV